MLKEKTILINRYSLIRELGSGAYSAVWLADDMAMHQKVAVKIYVPNGELDNEGVKTFKDEFSLVFNLNHSNILRPFLFDVEKNIPFLVLPYCQNGSALNRKGKMSERELWTFIHDVSSGLDYLHNHVKHIIHQDIKPANILIDDTNHFLISDFGISIKLHATIRKTMRTLARENNGAGTLAYMGPERFGTNPLPVFASDIWSLGATLFEIITGDVPFGEKGGLLQKGGADIPVIKQKVSKDLKELVYACLSKNPWDRPTAAEILKISNQRSYHRKRSLKGVGAKVAAGITAAVISAASVWMYSTYKANQETLSFNNCVQRGDSIIKQEQIRADMSISLVDGHQLEQSCRQAVSCYTEALTLSVNDTAVVYQTEQKINLLYELIDSCVAYNIASDTISKLESVERFATAQDYRNRKTQLAKYIKSKITEL